MAALESPNQRSVGGIPGRSLRIVLTSILPQCWSKGVIWATPEAVKGFRGRDALDALWSRQ